MNRIPVVEFSPKSIVAECFKSIAAKIAEEDYKESFKLKLFKGFQKVINRISNFL